MGSPRSPSADSTPADGVIDPETGIKVVRRSDLPSAADGPVPEQLANRFRHWVLDETQDAYAQRAFRELLRTQDKKVRLEAWKIAAQVLIGGSQAAKADGSGKVNFTFVNKVARPAKDVTPKPVVEIDGEVAPTSGAA